MQKRLKFLVRFQATVQDDGLQSNYQQPTFRAADHGVGSATLQTQPLVAGQPRENDALLLDEEIDLLDLDPLGAALPANQPPSQSHAPPSQPQPHFSQQQPPQQHGSPMPMYLSPQQPMYPFSQQQTSSLAQNPFAPPNASYQGSMQPAYPPQQQPGYSPQQQSSYQHNPFASLQQPFAAPQPANAQSGQQQSGQAQQNKGEQPFDFFM